MAARCRAGTLRVPSTDAAGRVDLRVDFNAYASLDLSGALQNTAEVGYVSATYNQLTSVDLDGCVQVSELYLQHNLLGEAAVDGILATLDSNPEVRPSGITLVVDLRGNSAPSAAGRASAASLAGKGWTVHTD